MKYTYLLLLSISEPSEVFWVLCRHRKCKVSRQSTLCKMLQHSFFVPLAFTVFAGKGSISELYWPMLSIHPKRILNNRHGRLVMFSILNTRLRSSLHVWLCTQQLTLYTITQLRRNYSDSRWPTRGAVVSREIRGHLHHMLSSGEFSVQFDRNHRCWQCVVCCSLPHSDSVDRGWLSPCVWDDPETSDRPHSPEN